MGHKSPLGASDLEESHIFSKPHHRALSPESIRADKRKLFIRRGPDFAFDPVGVLREKQSEPALARDLLRQWPQIHILGTSRRIGESGLHHDYEEWLEEVAPRDPVSPYQHNRTGEDNADAYIKRQIMGREVVVAVTDDRPDFGTWEQIFNGEFDGRRRKRVLVKIIGE